MMGKSDTMMGKSDKIAPSRVEDVRPGLAVAGGEAFRGAGALACGRRRRQRRPRRRRRRRWRGRQRAHPARRADLAAWAVLRRRTVRVAGQSLGRRDDFHALDLDQQRRVGRDAGPRYGAEALLRRDAQHARRVLRHPALAAAARRRQRAEPHVEPDDHAIAPGGRQHVLERVRELEREGCARGGERGLDRDLDLAVVGHDGRRREAFLDQKDPGLVGDAVDHGRLAVTGCGDWSDGRRLGADEE